MRDGNLPSETRTATTAATNVQREHQYGQQASPTNRLSWGHKGLQNGKKNKLTSQGHQTNAKNTEKSNDREVYSGASKSTQPWNTRARLQTQGDQTSQMSMKNT